MKKHSVPSGEPLRAWASRFHHPPAEISITGWWSFVRRRVSTLHYCWLKSPLQLYSNTNQNQHARRVRPWRGTTRTQAQSNYNASRKPQAASPPRWLTLAVYSPRPPCPPRSISGAAHATVPRFVVNPASLSSSSSRPAAQRSATLPAAPAPAPAAVDLEPLPHRTTPLIASPTRPPPLATGPPSRGTVAVLLPRPP